MKQELPKPCHRRYRTSTKPFELNPRIERNEKRISEETQESDKLEFPKKPPSFADLAKQLKFDSKESKEQAIKLEQMPTSTSFQKFLTICVLFIIVCFLFIQPENRLLSKVENYLEVGNAQLLELLKEKETKIKYLEDQLFLCNEDGRLT